MKFCKTCQTKKPLSEFHAQAKAKDGLDPRCKPCKSSRHKKKTYGVTEIEYNKLLRKQNYSCAICDTTAEDQHLGLCVDHCHDTGKVRGLLCSNCNSGIGMLKDDITLLAKAIQYLQEN